MVKSRLIQLGKYLIILVLYSTPAIMYGQDIPFEFEHITINEGLSQNSVNTIIQDREGFLWIGTTSGLNKFDGYNFTVYHTELDDPNSLSDNHIYAVFEDSYGEIWAGTNVGLNRYNKTTNDFTRFFHDVKNNRSISDNKIRTITEDHEHNLWIGTSNGLNKYVRDSNYFTPFFYDKNNPNSLIHNDIYTLLIDQSGNLWIGTTGGLDKFLLSEGKFTHFNPPEISNPIRTKKISFLLEDSQGHIWIGTNDGILNEYDPGQSKIFHYPFNPHPISPSDNSLYTFLEDSNHTLWIGTYGGLYTFNRKSKKITKFSLEIGNPRSLNSNQILSSFEDRSGVIWIGTRDGGLNKYSPNKRKFKHFYRKDDSENQLIFNNVYSFSKDKKDNVWIATFSGLSYFDTHQQTFTGYKHEQRNPNSLIDNIIWSVFVDHEGMVWIGTDSGLNSYDPKQGTFRLFQHDPQYPSTPSDNNIFVLGEDHHHNIWVGTNMGLNKFDRKTEKYTRYLNSTKDSTSVSHNVIWSIYKDRFDTLWIGTNNGLNKFHEKSQSFTRYFNEANNSSSLSNNNVYCIMEDHKGDLWIGTSVGINKYIREENKFISYTEKDGLTDNVIYALLEDGKDNLWMSTNKGLVVFNETTKTVRNYTVYDGLQSNEFNFAHCKLNDGRMLFGGIAGFNLFHPDSISNNSIIPPVVITGFKLFNEPVHVGDTVNGRILLPEPLPETKEIRLKHNENVFTIEFAGLHYVSPERNQYKYKMKGINDAWEDLGNRRFVPYTKLPPGDYTFQVIASNNDGIWNEEGASLHIIIQPPFWETWWFRIGFMVFIASAIYMLLKLRIRNIRLQKTKLERLVAEQTKELRETNATKNKFMSIISHDLRSPFNALLGLLNVFYESIEEFNKEKLKKVSFQLLHSANNLDDLLANLLSWSRTKSDKIVSTPETFDLSETIHNVFNLLHLIVQNKNIKLHSLIKKDTFVVADKHQISTVLRNLVSNAIKFSPSGSNIIVDSLERADHYEISIADNGVGIPPDSIHKLFREDIHFTTKGTNQEKGTGLGLLLCKEFVELNEGEIWAKSILNKGTTFFFTVKKFQKK